MTNRLPQRSTLRSASNTGNIKVMFLFRRYLPKKETAYFQDIANWSSRYNSRPIRYKDISDTNIIENFVDFRMNFQTICVYIISFSYPYLTF